MGTKATVKRLEVKSAAQVVQPVAATKIINLPAKRKAGLIGGATTKKKMSRHPRFAAQKIGHRWYVVNIKDPSKRAGPFVESEARHIAENYYRALAKMRTNCKGGRKKKVEGTL